MKNKFYLLLLAAWILPGLAFAQATLLSLPFTPNGPVYCQKQVGNTMYIGGAFSSLDVNSGALAGFSLSATPSALPLPNVNGQINTVVSDGAGGYFIGGSFNLVANQPRSNFAHLDASFNLIPNTTGFNGTVLNIVVSNGTAYAIGNFSYSTVNGSYNLYRPYVAAVNVASGNISSWTSGIGGGSVSTGIVSNNRLYIGGTFLLNGSYRCLAAYDVSTSTAVNIPSFNPLITYNGSTTSASVQALAVGGGQIYIGGNFNAVNNQVRSNFAGINTTTGIVSSVYAALNGNVTCLAWDNSLLFVGGNFATVNGASKQRLFAYNTTAFSTMNNWSPNPNGNVNKMGVVNGNLWVSGTFTSISSIARSTFASYVLSPTLGVPPSFNALFSPNPNAQVNSIIAAGSTIWIAGGNFNKISAGTRNGVAAIDLSNNTLTNFAPNVSGSVYAIEVSGSNVFLGGTFNIVNGNIVSNFATVNINSGLSNTAYRANFNNQVRSILVVGSTMYVGGSFSNTTIYAGTTANSFTRIALAAITLGPSNLTIQPIFNTNLVNYYSTPSVAVLKLINGNLFAGGYFSSPRNALVSLNPTTGATNMFNANIGNAYSRVNDLVLTPQNQLVIGGYIPTVSAITTQNLAYVDPFTGSFIRSNAIVNTAAISNEPMALCNGNNSDILYINQYGLMRTLNQSGASVVAYSHSGSHSSMVKMGNAYFIGGNFSYSNPINGSLATHLMGVSFTPAIAPTQNASGLNFSAVTTNSMRINWTNGGGAARMVLVRALYPVSTQPMDMNTYSGVSVFGSGSNIGGAFVVYNGTGNYVDVTNLQPGTNYQVKVIEYNGSGITTTYAASGLSGQQTTADFLPPLVGSSNITASSISKTGMYLNWNPGIGSGRILVARAGSPVNALPQINVRYNGNASFGFGSDLGNGNFVVAAGAVTSSWLYNLSPSTTYHFAVFEYNENGYYVLRYKTDTYPTNSFTTLANVAEPSLAAGALNVQNVGGGVAKVSWTRGNGNGRILMVNASNISNVNGVFIADENSYTANNNIVSYNPYPSSIGVTDIYANNYAHQVCYNGNGDSTFIYGLNSGATYNFILMEYNTLGPGTENYMQNAWAAVNFTMPPLVNAPNVAPTAVKLVASSNNAGILSWTNGNGNNRIVVCKQGAPVTFVPSDNVAYSGNSVFGSGTSYGGNYILYSGSANNVSISNLTAYTDYYFAVYEFNLAYNSYTLQNEIKFLATPGVGNGKTQAPNWPRVAGGNGTDAAGGMGKDQNGNVYVAGTFNGSAYFGVTPVNGSSNQIFLAKYSANGVIQWVQSAGGADEDAASSVAVDNAGNSYVVGSFRSTASFSGNLVTSYGTDDAFIAKYNASGVLQWVRTMGGTGQDVAFWAKVDGNGDVLVTGYFQGNPSFSNSTQTLTSSGNSDVWVAKYGSGGNLIWAVGAGGNSYDYGHCVTTGASNSVIIAGEYKTSATFGSTVLTNTGSESNGFIAKLNSSGGWDWAKSVGGNGVDAIYGVATDTTDNYYISGLFSDTAYFGNNNVVSEGLTDGFVARVNSNGNIQWVSRFGGISKDMAGGVSISSNGNVFVAGSFAGTININGTPMTAAGNQDIVVAAFTQTGILLQASRYGGNLNDQARGILANNTGDAFICGYYEGTANFSGFEATANGNNSNPLSGDMFVHNIGSVYSSNPNADLIAWYKFNGNYNDFSGNNFNGSTAGSPVFVNDRQNTANSALAVNNSFVNATFSNALQFDNINEFTYSGWVKLNSYNGGGMQMIAYTSNTLNSYSTFLIYTEANGKVMVYLFDGLGYSNCAYYVSPDNMIPLNTWTHVTFTFKTNNFSRLYINGILVSGGSTFAANNLTGMNDKLLNMGGMFNYGSYYYPLMGGLDDVRLYKKALSQTEIMTIMAATSANSAPPIELISKDGIKTEPSVLFPNPNEGIFNLSFTNPEERNLQFRLIDLSGKVIYDEPEMTYEAGPQVKNFQFSNLNKGYYVLQLVQNNQVLENHKVIVHH